MSSSTRCNALSSSCFLENETCLDIEVCDPLAAFGSSFGCANDKHEFYGDPDFADGNEDSDDNELAVSDVDMRARGLSIDRFFASDVRAFGEGGPWLSAMADGDDNDNEDDGNRSDSVDARSFVDGIFPSGSTPTRYRVALAPSLGAIEEDESEFGLGDDIDSEGVDCPLISPSSLGSDFGSEMSSSAAFSISESEDFDSIRLSVTSFSTLDEDQQRRADGDPDFGWVWIEVEDSEAEEPQHLPLTRSCEVSLSLA
ncbi:hypothetical protein GSI_15088 [Ganoderma sinense ZZ0214-1]|uniref:Uncharacterized protein n=1 Tax=Ganoderma sinense ZZ0214-1 TaxID=1077348 RepID=A0A2G8RLL7_9APHY|nr:hypothetical protein GSI_15088 [Ganoderma sinense ZZ0214-1]